MCANPVSITKAPSNKAMTNAERDLRVDLAACYRLVAHFDMDDLFATHISARVPGKDEHFLINPYGVLFSQITASSLVKVDLDANILQDTEYDINPAGFVIHSAIHAARPDVACIIHTHTIAGMAVASQQDGLLPICQKALKFMNRTAYHDFEGKAQDLDERQRLVRDLGDKNHLILRNHGLLVCGPTISWAFKRIYGLEKSCKTQLAAQASGAALVMLSDDLVEFTAKQFDRDDAPGTSGRPDGWDSLLALMDSIDPSYRD
ncbi:MAG: class II aldolase/adducin family protein [Alphaproteobacteria bacterium]